MKFQFIRDWVYAIPISKPLQEVILSLLRIGLSAAISAILAYLAVQVKLLPVEWQGLVIVILTIITKEWDKYKYVENEENRVKGVKNYGLIGF